MVVNFINLFFREDRLTHFQQQAKEQCFDYIRFEAIHNKKNPKEGITQSHKAVVRKAKEDGLDMCVVCEDDIRFFDVFAYDYFLSQIPKSFDLFFGLIYVGDVDSNNRVISSFSGGMTLYVIHSRFYDWFLSQPDNVHVDRHTGDYANDFEFYVCHPYVCEQIAGYSDNRHQKVLSYDVYLEGKDLYTYKN